jgi:hypothetical protein
MAGQLAPNAVSITRPELRQQPARARDLLRLEALKRVLKRSGEQQL